MPPSLESTWLGLLEPSLNGLIHGFNLSKGGYHSWDHGKGQGQWTGAGLRCTASSLPGTPRHSLRARPWLLRPAPAKPLNEEGPFPSTGLARGECGTNIRFLSVLQCEADDKIITSPRGYRLKISAGSRRVLRVLWFPSIWLTSGCGTPTLSTLDPLSLLAFTPWTVAHQPSLSREFPRQEYWSSLPFPPPGDLPDPGIKSTSLAFPALAATICPTIH